MAKLNNYSIVVGKNATYNELATAKFLASNIAIATGYQPKVYTDDNPAEPYEIVVGKTAREESFGVSFEREAGRDYEYELRFADGRLYLTGYGIPFEKEGRNPFNAYATFAFGSIGTDLAAFRFAEQTFGGGMLFPADLSMITDLDASEIEIDERYNFVFTAEKLRTERPERVEGAALYVIPSATSLKVPRNSMIFKSADGTFAVYDGGFESDAEQLCDILEYLNDGRNEKPRVSAWLISAPLISVAGAFKAVCEREELRSRLSVERVYTALLDDEFYTCGSREAGEVHLPALTAIRTAGETIGCETVKLSAGDKIEAGDFRFEVVFTPTEETKLIDRVHICDATVVFRAECNGRSVLLWGGSRNEASKKILEKCPEALKCDIMAVSRNGEGGVSKLCYGIAGAKKYICQTTCAKYFGDNGEGFAASADSITRTRNYISECGIKYDDILKDIYGILTIEF